MSKKSRAPLPNFRRATTADQVAVNLREGMEKGLWGNRLPSERELARHLGVSRPSVHAALLELARAGVVENGNRRVARVLSPRPSPATVPMACIATPFSREAFGSALAEDPFRLVMRAQLADAGIGWNETIDARLGKKEPGRYLSKLVAEHGRACWLIDNSSPGIQHWFEQARIPTLVLGSCYAGVRLPSIDTDYHAIGRHAASHLLRHGHRRLALILAPHAKPGDLACRDSIVQALAESTQPMSVVEMTAKLNPARLRLEFDRLLARRPRPTVVFTMLPEITQTVLLHLLRSGIRVPDEISLISRDSHALFDVGAPEITRYDSSNVKKAHVIVRVVQSLLAGRPVSAKPILLTPTFVPGGTFSRPPG